MRFTFVAAEKASYSVEALCRHLAVSPSGFYAWRGRRKSERRQDDQRLAAEVAAAHVRSGARYGSPRVMHQLRRQGRFASRKRVARLMREQGLFGRKRRRYRTTTDSNHDEPIAPNLVARDFHAEKPGMIMVGNTTAVATKQGWLYLAVMLDLCTRAIVRWAMSETNDTELISKAFRAALTRRFQPGFIHHTDRGSTYASRDYRALVEAAGGRRSMSRRADCYDNAVAESAFRTIKEEALGEATPETTSEAREKIFSFIEGFYNSTRLHSTLGYRTPNEVERTMTDGGWRPRRRG